MLCIGALVVGVRPVIIGNFVKSKEAVKDISDGRGNKCGLTNILILHCIHNLNAKKLRQKPESRQLKNVCAMFRSPWANTRTF